MAVMVPFENDEAMVFGDSFQRTIEWCVTDAMRLNTPEAWQTAADELRGLSRLIEVMREPARGRFVWTILRLQPIIARCHDLALEAVA